MHRVQQEGFPQCPVALQESPAYQSSMPGGSEAGYGTLLHETQQAREGSVSAVCLWTFTATSGLVTHTHTHLTALFPGLPRWVSTRKVKPIWILLKQETVSGSGIGWAVCKSAPCCRQITTPASHYSVFYRPDALPAVQPTASKHWSRLVTEFIKFI